MDNQRVDWPHLGDGSQRKGSRNHLHHAYSAQVHEDDVRAVDADGVTIAPRGLLGRCYLRKDIAQQSPRLDLQPPRDPRDVVDRHVALRPLNAAEVRTVDAALVGERPLAQPALGAQHVAKSSIVSSSLGVNALYRPPVRNIAITHGR
jgi:hypothetical protein